MGMKSDLSDRARYGHPVRPRTKPGGLATRRLVARPEMKRPVQKEASIKRAPPPKPAEAPPVRASTPTLPAVEPLFISQSSLDPLTARVLEEELQQLMIQVWQILPDEPTDAIEKVVVEKFRNEAGDQLRDALGLNVTKRLLNIFNPLNVKVHFSTKPERKYLRQFLKQYNFVAFKRAAGVVNTFAAQVRSVADYDRLTGRNDISCGAAKITITPYYRFRQCPKNLKTVYSTPEDDKEAVTAEILEKVMAEYDEMDATAPNDTIAPATNVFKQVEEAQKKADAIARKSVATSTIDQATMTAENDKLKAKNVNKNVLNKTAPINTQPIAQINKPKEAQAKPAVEPAKPQNKITPVKPLPTPPAQNKTVAAKPPVQTAAKPAQAEKKTTPVKPQPKVEPAKTNTANKTEPAKPSPAIKAEPAKPSPANKTEPAKPSSANKIEPAKPNPANKAVPAKPSTEAIKPQAQTEANKPKAVEAKPAPVKKVESPKAKVFAKTTNVKTVETKNITQNNAKVVNKTADTTKVAKGNANSNKQKNARKSDDFEELDDEAILALMSGGIVLDECSGSDVE